MTSPVQNSEIGQDEYMKLFMQELSYQDPLKPVDNREFMSQMAQFSALQQATSSVDLLQKIAAMTSANQSLMLLGKKVQVDGSEGTVMNVKFINNSPPILSIHLPDEPLPMEVALKDVTEVES